MPENTNTVIADYATWDPEGEDVDLSLGGADAGDFSLGDDGELRFSPPPDYDSPADAGHRQRLQHHHHGHRREQSGSAWMWRSP